MSEKAIFADNWDLTSYFPEFDDTKYRETKHELESRIGSVQEKARQLDGLTTETASGWSGILRELEQIMVDLGHIGSYLGCLRADDARNERVQVELASLTEVGAENEKTWVLVQAALKGTDDSSFNALVEDSGLEGCRYHLERLRSRARQTMDADLEELASDLSITGFSAWGRLYTQLAGRLEFDLVKPDGSVEKTPFSLKNSLTENSDPDIRKAALEGSNAAWQQVEHVAAASLNAIAGTRLTLYRRRGIDHFLEPALFSSGVTRQTLDAMLEAIADSYELPRQYLQIKAELMGKESLGFQDLMAPIPLPEEGEPVDWSSACQRILNAFTGTYPKLASFTEHAFANRWVESEPRASKSPGGFCTSSMKTCESRIFMTYNETLGDIQTLAHELGHAYHNWVMTDIRPYARCYPMTLAETASTFAETLFTDAILEDPDSSERDRLVVLDTRLANSVAFLLNIPMRFIFEKAFYEERSQGEVSVSRLKELVLDAQRETFGPILDPNQMDPYFWASKLHFFITGVSFYNFPYSFGYLFSLGVYSRAKKEGSQFYQTYEDLLRLTGSDTAENVARRTLGIDLESKAFWLESITQIKEDLDRFRTATTTMV